MLQLYQNLKTNINFGKNNKTEMNKISIITINYNNINGLKKTIASVASQSFKDFEYIIIDGESTDGSKKFLEEIVSTDLVWISENDSGIYNAMNKGIRLAKGDFLLFLNSGDVLFSEKTIENVQKKIDGEKDLYFGDAIFKYPKGDVFVSYPDKLTFKFFIDNSLCHQTCFIKRTLFKEIFYYNEDFKVISDWEFMIYALCVKNISYQHIPETVSYYDLDGISSNPTYKAVIKQETDTVMNKYFKMYISDYQEYKGLNVLKSKRILNILYIKEFPTAWKFLKGFSNLILLFLPNKK